jgi:tetratricopeptide (TPR) repeat protein
VEILPNMSLNTQVIAAVNKYCCKDLQDE